MPTGVASRVRLCACGGPGALGLLTLKLVPPTLRAARAAFLVGAPLRRDGIGVLGPARLLQTAELSDGQCLGDAATMLARGTLRGDESLAVACLGQRGLGG